MISEKCQVEFYQILVKSRVSWNTSDLQTPMKVFLFGEFNNGKLNVMSVKSILCIWLYMTSFEHIAFDLACLKITRTPSSCRGIWQVVTRVKWPSLTRQSQHNRRRFFVWTKGVIDVCWRTLMVLHPKTEMSSRQQNGILIIEAIWSWKQL